ncbi:MAG: hypothetical protein ACRDYY_14335, partial [Acidimicrobiales bacterium]
MRSKDSGRRGHAGALAGGRRRHATRSILAVVVETAGTKASEGGSKRFPALDPEPAHRPWLSILGPWAVLAIIGAVIAAVVVGLGGSSHPKPRAAPVGPLAGARGRIISFSYQDGEFSISAVDGSDVRPLPSIGRLASGRAGLFASPDRRFLATTSGQVYSLGSGTPVIEHTQIHLGGNQILEGFADGDKALLVTDQTPYAALSAVTIPGGKVTSLGTADTAAGDPQHIGAFVSVAGAPIPLPSQQGFQPNEQQPDVRVELRDAGGPAVVLGTAASLNKVLGMDPAEPVTLTAVPGPAGDKVAVIIGLANAAGGPPP